MPHSGVNQPKESMIAARVDQARVRCRRCGQFLWNLDGDRLAPSDSSVAYGIAGWRLAPDSVWRPTAYHREQRRRADTRLSTKAVSDDKQFILRQRLALNLFRRQDMDIVRADDDTR